MTATHFSLSFGALSPPLATQLRKQGLAFNNNNRLAQLQADVDAITRLAVRGVIASSAKRRADRDVVKKIMAGLVPYAPKKKKNAPKKVTFKVTVSTQAKLPSDKMLKGMIEDGIRDLFVGLGANSRLADNPRHQQQLAARDGLVFRVTRHRGTP